MDMYIILLVTIVVSLMISNWLILIEQDDMSVDTVVGRNFDNLLQPILFVMFSLFSFYLVEQSNIVVAVVYVFLLVSTVFDIKYRLAPDFINAIILIASVGYLLVTERHMKALAEPLILGTLLVVILIVLSFLGDNMTVGGGDIKLLFALCFTLTFDYIIILIFFYALVTGVLITVYCFAKGKSLFGFKYPALPFITIAYVLTVLYAEKVIKFYVTGGWFV